MQTDILTSGRNKVKLSKRYEVLMTNNSNRSITIKTFQKVAVTQYGVTTTEMAHTFKPPAHITVNKITEFIGTDRDKLNYVLQQRVKAFIDQEGRLGACKLQEMKINLKPDYIICQMNCKSYMKARVVYI